LQILDPPKLLDVVSKSIFAATRTTAFTRKPASVMARASLNALTAQFKLAELSAPSIGRE
jgi:hypothetical protein